MQAVTYSGVVENGQIRLGENVTLPEKALVYVVVPGSESPSPVIASPRLRDPQQAADFQKVVVEDHRDAGV